MERSEINPYVRKLADGTAIDVYEAAVVFEITDPCLFHCFKKIVGPGSGEKSKELEIREAKQSLERWLQINEAYKGTSVDVDHSAKSIQENIDAEVFESFKEEEALDAEVTYTEDELQEKDFMAMVGIHHANMPYKYWHACLFDQSITDPLSAPVYGRIQQMISDLNGWRKALTSLKFIEYVDKAVNTYPNNDVSTPCDAPAETIYSLQDLKEFTKVLKQYTDDSPRSIAAGLILTILSILRVDSLKSIDTAVSYINSMEASDIDKEKCLAFLSAVNRWRENLPFATFVEISKQACVEVGIR